MQFQWDESKNEINIDKHDLAFDDAHLVWQDVRFARVDTRFDYGETRYVTLGTIESVVVVLVWSQPEPTTVRVISLRKASSYERTAYQNLFQNQLGESDS